MVARVDAVEQPWSGAYGKVRAFLSRRVWKETHRKWPPLEVSMWHFLKQLQVIILLSGVLHTLFPLTVLRGTEQDTRVNLVGLVLALLGLGRSTLNIQHAPSKETDCDSMHGKGREVAQQAQQDLQQTQHANQAQRQQQQQQQQTQEHCKRCASHVSYVSRKDSGRTPRRGPASCRVVTKLNGMNLPQHVPQRAVAELQRELGKYHCSAPAMRVGCIVISCDMISDASTSGTLEEVCEGMLEVARAWAEREGLLRDEGDEVTVQVCHFCDWASMHDPEASPVGPYQMSMRAPFLIASRAPTSTPIATQHLPTQHAQALSQGEHTEADRLRQQLQQGHAKNEEGLQSKQQVASQHGCTPGEAQQPLPTEQIQQEEAFCAFELTLCAPRGLELRGWQGAADAPEDLADKDRSLCLLACMDGCFLGVTVEDQRILDNGERVAQVCVSLPSASMDRTPLTCPKLLQLEMWAQGALVCSYSAAFFPEGPYPSAAFAELQVQEAGQTGVPDAKVAFTRDLVTWLLFQIQHRQLQQQQQQQQQVAEHGCNLPESFMKHLELMVEVGKDLLHHSLISGMEAVAGLVLDGLAAFPFCIPPSTLLDEIKPTMSAKQGSPSTAETSTLKEITKDNTTAAARQPAASSLLRAAGLPAGPIPVNTFHCEGHRGDTTCTLDWASGVQKASSVPPPPPAATSTDLSGSPFTSKQSSPLPTTCAQQETTPTLPRHQLPAASSIDSGSQSARTHTATPAAQQAARPVQCPGRMACSQGVMRSILAAIAWLVFGAEVSQEEAEYRAWTNGQVAPLARLWCRLWVLNMGVGALRMAWTKGLPPLLELSSWGAMLLGYSLGACFIRSGSPTSEGIIAATTISRIIYGITLGTGLVPISPTLALVFHYRLEACIEAFMMSVMERVRLRWAIPLRALLTISTACFYSRLGFPFPFLQSLLVNLCGLGVTVIVEWRYRRLYSHPRLHAKQRHMAEGSVRQAPAHPCVKS